MHFPKFFYIIFFAFNSRKLCHVASPSSSYYCSWLFDHFCRLSLLSARWRVNAQWKERGDSREFYHLGIINTRGISSLNCKYGWCTWRQSLWTLNSGRSSQGSIIIANHINVIETRKCSCLGYARIFINLINLPRWFIHCLIYLSTCKCHVNFCTRLGCYLEKRFCKLFAENSTIVLQLSLSPCKQGNSQKIAYKTSSASNSPS